MLLLDESINPKQSETNATVTMLMSALLPLMMVCFLITSLLILVGCSLSDSFLTLSDSMFGQLPRHQQAYCNKYSQMRTQPANLYVSVYRLHVLLPQTTTLTQLIHLQAETLSTCQKTACSSQPSCEQ